MKNTIALYVHIPFCKKRCSYCTFLSNCNYSLQSEYFQQLNTELFEYGKKTKHLFVDTIFLGGGTPSSVDIKYLDALFETIYSNFAVLPNAEITVECNPESISQDVVHCFVCNKVNRVSLGLQSSNNNTLKLIGRLHTYQDFCDAIKILTKHNITNINADIIIGLPETHKDFLTTISNVVKLPVTHISVYALEVASGSVMEREIAENKYSVVSDPDVLANWYDDAIELLSANSFGRYEVSNFSKDGYCCKHNLHYWNSHNYIGAGCSAHGYFGDVRYENTSDLQEYISGKTIVNQVVLNSKDKKDEFVMLGLRLDCGVSMSDYHNRFGSDLLADFPSFAKLIANGYLKQQNDNIAVDSSKMYVLNAILLDLLQ